jgi:hypothetical protein
MAGIGSAEKHPMSVRPIIDAGPGLNFLSINKERLLIAVLGPISAPETVRDEVFRKSRQDDRFRAAAAVWRKLTGRWIQILPDDVTPELAAVVQRISGLPMAERINHAKDLGGAGRPRGKRVRPGERRVDCRDTCPFACWLRCGLQGAQGFRAIAQ